MAEADLELIQENIEEYVNDDNKVVTCRWLSLTLNIHINIAKQALFTYAQHHRNSGGNDDVNVTYFVAGLGQTKAGEPIHKCVVVQEQDLEAVKTSLDCVTSCHVYSVQKSRLKDYTALYQTDYDIIQQNIDKSASLGSIKCPWATLRSNKPVQETTKKSSSPAKKETKPSIAPSSGAGDKTSPPDGAAGKNKKPEPKGSIANMFASSTAKKGNQTAAAKAPAQKAGAETAKTSSQKKGVAAFFEKGSTAKPAAQAAQPKVSQDKKDKKNRTSPKARKAEPESDDEAPQRKKRRRIKQDLFDSSDEEQEDVNENEEEETARVVEESEEEEEVKEEEMEEENKEEPKVKSPEKKKEESMVIIVNAEGRRRKRVRRLVPKQHIDEEGFMVTEKVWESDSTDVDDDEIEEEKKRKKEEEEKRKKAQVQEKGKPLAPGNKTGPKKTAASPQKSKQTSLMSFFKKK